MKDPIVEGLRQARDVHTKQFNDDVGAIRDDLRKRENESDVLTVSLPPKCVTREKSRLHDDVPDTVSFPREGTARLEAGDGLSE